MTDENDGLAGLPPARRPWTPPPEPRAPDLQFGDVSDSLMRTADRGGEMTQPWAKALDTASRSPNPPSFKPFIGPDADPLNRPDSMLDQAVGADPSMWGMLTGVGSGMLTMLGHPISAFTDEYQVSKIRDLQEAFLKKHDYVLKQLSEEVGEAKLNMRRLADLMDEANIYPSKLEQIMKDKRAAGERARQQIGDALAAAKTPEERRRLEAMKADMDAWAAERDQRLDLETPAYDLIHDKVDSLSRSIEGQRRMMRDAANSPGPSTVTGGQPGEPSHVLETTHTQPDAALHVASLHNFLLQTRAGMGGR